MAERLGHALDAPVIDADRTRKRLSGVTAKTSLEAPPFSGAYSAEATRAVYAELGRCARAVLQSGRSVVLDATFRSAAQRHELSRLAQEFGVDWVFVECRAAEDVVKARLKQREQGTHISDGRLGLYDSFKRSYEPVTELPKERHQIVDTGAEGQASLSAVLSSLGREPPQTP